MEDTPSVQVDSTSLNAVADQADAAFDAAFNSGSVQEAAAPETPAGSTPSEPVAPVSSETAQPAGSTPVAQATPVVPSTPEQSDEWKNLLAKHNGDQNAAAKSYWENVRSATQLAREKEELAAKLAAYEAQGSTPKAAEAQQQAVKEIPNELRRYDENIRAVEKSFETTQQERAKYVAYGSQLDQEIRTLNRQIANPSLTVDKDELVSKLTDRISEREATTNWIAKLDGDLRSFDEKWQDLKDRREIRSQILEQAKELEAAREAKARSEEEQDVKAFKQTWDGTIEKVSKDTTVIPAQLSARFEKYVRALGMAHVAGGNPVEDVDKFVREAAQDYMSGAKEFHQVQSAEYAKQKKADERIESPAGKDAIASDTKRPRSDWTQKQWDEYHENFQL